MFKKDSKIKLESRRLRLEVLKPTKKNRAALESLLADPEIKKEWIESGLWRKDLLPRLLREWPKGARVWKGKTDRFMRLDLVMIEKKSKLLIGHIPLSWNKKDESLEIGYFVLGSKRGRGYAREAVKTILEWASELPEPPIVYSWAAEKNLASRALLMGINLAPSAKCKIDGRVQRCYSRDLAKLPF